MSDVTTLALEFVDELRNIIDPSKLSFDESTLQLYGKDWTTVYEPAPSAIVFVQSIEQLQAIVRLANKHLVALVPSGGRTGLSGAAMATQGEVVISFEQMNTIFAYNAIDRSVVCEAGVITQQLQEFALEQGLYYPVDFASSGSSQIGGNISTNAGGIKVIRYGMTRDWVAGLTVVTGAGEIVELNVGLQKNNAGYDLRQLFIGAEGTLGFIVNATIRLVRPPQDLTVLVLGVPNMSSLMKVLDTYQSAMDLTAFEFFSDKALDKVVAHTGLQRPFETAAPLYALLEFEKINQESEDLAMQLFERCVEQAWVNDGVISQSIEQRNNLWRLREDISETISKWTPYKNDISTVVSKIPAFLAEIEAVVTAHYPDFEILWYGHIGDGNVHLNILKPAELEKAQFLQQCHAVNQWVFEIVQKYRGSISAEHGVGLVKKEYLHYSRSQQEINLMKQIKHVFDPNGIMNPGKIFD